MPLPLLLHTGRADAETIADHSSSRRNFLKATTALGGGLLVSFVFPALERIAEAAVTGSEESFVPNGFVRVNRDGRVTLIMPQVEMGQGTYTAMSMLLAEELEVGIDQIYLEPAPPNDNVYANAVFAGIQVTGGSTSVRAFWEPLRRAGAVARVMLVSAAAQSWGVEQDSCRAERGAVVHAPTGRKLAYRALAEKAATLPVPGEVRLKEPEQFKLIGTAAKRIDTPDKVRGKAQYGIDTKLPGMKIATVAACPVLGGRLGSVDDTKARAIRGVHQVVRLDNAVAVVADHTWAAKQGLGALAIQWDEGPNRNLSTADIVRQLEAASQHDGALARKQGNVLRGMAEAAQKLEAVYQVPFLAHATMEPMNCTVHVRDDGCDVWVGTQVATRTQAAAAHLTGLPLDRVRVHNHLLGCGFGRRLEVDFVVQAVQIAKQVDGPVKVVWTREEDIQHDFYRPYYYDRIRAGLDERALPVAWTHRIAGASNIARWLPEAFKDGFDADAVDAAAQLPYALPSMLVDYVRQEPPSGINIGWWRGVGPVNNVFTVESFIDELAAAAGRDPVDYRRELLSESPRVKAVLNLAADKSGWGQALPVGSGRGVCVQQAFGSYMAQVAQVAVSKEGEVRVERVVCAVDCGMVVNPDTVRAQIEGGIIFGISAALFGEITLKNGRVEQTNFGDYRVLRINEAPAVEVYLVNSTELPGGIGEPGTAAVAPAVANAVHAATGKRIRKLPLADQLQSK